MGIIIKELVDKKTYRETINGELSISRDEIVENVNAWYKEFQKAQGREGEPKYAYVSYLYGQGGIGKSFLCGKLAQMSFWHEEKEKNKTCYLISYDLNQRTETSERLFALAEKVVDVTGDATMFPLFGYAYARYRSLMGKKEKEIEWSTKYEKIMDNAKVKVASGTLAFIPGVGSIQGTLTGTLDLANQWYKSGVKAYEHFHYKDELANIDRLNSKELSELLSYYFAKDISEYRKKDITKKEKRFVFVLDTLECLQYTGYGDENIKDALSWLMGENGIVRLLPNTFWILAGREEIDWQEFEDESERQMVSVQSIEIKAASKEAIINYLTAQKLSEKEAELIYNETQGYTLSIMLYLELYYNMWNRCMEECGVMSAEGEDIDSYRPQMKELAKVFSETGSQRIVTERFLMYYNKQERELFYMLAILGRWTERMLEQLVWHNASGLMLCYEEMKKSSAIAKHGDIYCIQGLEIDRIRKESPLVMKRTLADRLMDFLKSGNSRTDEEYVLYMEALQSCMIALQSGAQAKWDSTLCMDDLSEALLRCIRYMLETRQLMRLETMALRGLCLAEDSATEWKTLSLMSAYFCAVMFEKQEQEKELLKSMGEVPVYGEVSKTLCLILNGNFKKYGYYAESYHMIERIFDFDDIQAEIDEVLGLKLFELMVDSMEQRIRHDNCIQMYKDQVRIYKKSIGEEGGTAKEENAYQRKLEKAEKLKLHVLENCDLRFLEEQVKRFEKRWQQNEEPNSEHVLKLYGDYCRALSYVEGMTGKMQECIENCDKWCAKEQREQDADYISMKIRVTKEQDFAAAAKIAWDRICFLYLEYKDDVVQCKEMIDLLEEFLFLYDFSTDHEQYGFSQEDFVVLGEICGSFCEEFSESGDLNTWSVISMIANFAWLHDLDYLNVFLPGLRRLFKKCKIDNKPIYQLYLFGYIHMVIRVAKNASDIKLPGVDDIRTLEKQCNDVLLDLLVKEGEKAAKNDLTEKVYYDTFCKWKDLLALRNERSDAKYWSDKGESLDVMQRLHMCKWLGMDVEEEFLQVGNKEITEDILRSLKVEKTMPL